MNRTRILPILLLLSAPWAALSAVLSGRVTDRQTDEGLPGAYVTVAGTDVSAVTGERGTFRLAGLKPGTHVVHVSMVGYQRAQVRVELGETMSEPLLIQLEPGTFPLPPLVITATRGRTSRIDVPSSVDVISIAGAGHGLDITDALVQVPGVVIKDYGSLGDVKTASLRGSSSGQVLVLLDGQRLNSAQSGEVDMSTVPLDGVERIEVVRGGGSALYGADAVGGVINIISAGGSEQGVSADAAVHAGSFGLRGGSVAGRLGGEELTGRISYRYLTSTGDFPYHSSRGEEMRRDNADATTQHLFGGLQWSPSGDDSRRTAAVSLRHFRSSAGSPGSLEFPSPRARKAYNNFAGQVSYEQEISTAVPMVRAEAFGHAMELTFDDPASYVPVHTESRNGAWGAELRGRILPGGMQTVTLGAALRQDRLTGNALGGAHQRRLISAYLQDEVALFLGPSERWRLSVLPAMRWDSFSDFGEVFSPRIGGVVRAEQGDWIASLRAQHGRSFRAPAFNDLYWPRDNFAAGNPLLAPERAQDTEVGAALLLPFLVGLETDLALFWNRITDMVIWQPGTDGIWTPRNVGKADIRGLEARVGLAPWGELARVEWNYAFLKALNRNDDPAEHGRQLPYRPRHAHRLALTFAHGRMAGTVQLLYTGKRYVTTFSGQTLPAYRVLDASLGYTWGERPLAIEAVVEGRNLTDTWYQSIEGFPMPGREVRVSLAVRLRDRN